MHKLLMKELGSYRFFYSVETITGKDQVPYLIDLTLRIGSPSPLSIYLDLYENFAEIICGMAVGEKIAPKVKEGAKYAASANHTLDECENFTNIEIPKEVRPWAKLVRGCKKSGDFYSVPDWKVGVTVLGFGKTPKEAIEEAKNHSKEIKGKGLVDNSRFLDDYYKDIEEAKEIGVDF
jgi:phosphoribosylamine-glycine ligase